MLAENIKNEVMEINLDAEFQISYYEDKIATLQAVNEVCTDPRIIELNEKTILFARRCIQRVRLAQLLAMEHAAQMEIIQGN